MAADPMGVVNNAAFASAFPALRPVILGEWSEVDEKGLAETAGELDRVVALVAERTGHTKTLVRRHLDELYYVVTKPPAEPAASFRPRRSPAEAHPPLGDILEELERRTTHIISELRGGFMSEARDRVKQNVIFSLLVSVGLGFIVGVLYSGFSRGK